MRSEKRTGTPAIRQWTLFIPVPVLLVIALAITGCSSGGKGGAAHAADGSTVADVRAFDAKDDGTTDATATIQAALNSDATTIMITGNVYKVTDELNIPSGKRVIGDGKVIIRAGTVINSKGIFRLNGNSMLEGVNIDANCSFSAGVIQSDGAEFGARVIDSSYNTVRNCTVKNHRTTGIYVGVWDATQGSETHYNTIDNNYIEGHTFTNAGTGIGGMGITVQSNYPARLSELAGDLTHPDYTYTFKCTHNKIINNTVNHTGVLGINVDNAAYNIIEGNTILANSGSSIELEIRAVGNTCKNNVITDFGANGISIAYNSFDNVVEGNTIEGTGTIGAINIFYGTHDNIVKNNTIDSRFDIYAGPEQRKPGSGITVGQYSKNITIEGNVIKGYQRGIYAVTTYYAPAPDDPEFFLTGFQDLLIRNNIILSAYTLESPSGTRLAMPQNTLYGIYLHKNTAYDDTIGGAYGGALPYTGIVVDGNIVDGVEYSYIIQEVTATAAHPAQFKDIVFQNNQAKNCTSGTGFPIYAQ